MRTATSAQLALLAQLLRSEFIRVEIEDGAGVLQDRSVWIQSASITEDINNRVATGSLTLIRDATAGPATGSLARMMTGSPLNRVLGSYAPAVDVVRRVRFWTAVVPYLTTPSTSDWRLLLDGLIVDIDDAKNPITLAIADAGTWLVDTYIEAQRNYSNAVGVPVQGVVQQIIADNMAIQKGGAPTLYVKDDPAWNIRGLAQDYTTVMDACSALLVDQRGMDFRYRFDGADNYRLTVYEPNRAQTTADLVLGPSSYFALNRNRVSKNDIRTAINVKYLDKDSGQKTPVTSVSNPTILAQFGRRWGAMEYVPNIDTAPVATALADRVRSDLEMPDVEREVVAPFRWDVQLNDMIQCDPNGVTEDIAIVGAVASIKHEFEKARGRTTYGLRAKPSAQYRRWLKLTVPPDVVGPGAQVQLPTWSFTPIREGDRWVLRASFTIVTSPFFLRARYGVQHRVPVASGTPNAWSPLVIQEGSHTGPDRIIIESNLEYQITPMTVSSGLAVLEGAAVFIAAQSAPPPATSSPTAPPTPTLQSNPVGGPPTIRCLLPAYAAAGDALKLYADYSSGAVSTVTLASGDVAAGYHDIADATAPVPGTIVYKTTVTHGTESPASAPLTVTTNTGSGGGSGSGSGGPLATPDILANRDTGDPSVDDYRIRSGTWPSGVVFNAWLSTTSSSSGFGVVGSFSGTSGSALSDDALHWVYVVAHDPSGVFSDSAPSNVVIISARSGGF